MKIRSLNIHKKYGVFILYKEVFVFFISFNMSFNTTSLLYYANYPNYHEMNRIVSVEK